MQQLGDGILLSPTDLTKHVACPHVTTLDLLALTGAGPTPKAPDDALNLVFAKGLEHEREYLDALRAEGRIIVAIPTRDADGARVPPAEGERLTLEAMRSGVDVIFQATLFDGEWMGYADFLLRVERPSELGGWSYDVADTKLARRLKVPALLQMATYADRLTELQGVPPTFLTVVTGDKASRPWRLVDVASYARRRRRALRAVLAERPPTEPVPTAHCVQCRWVDHCAGLWRDSDDLVGVAGMRQIHRSALRDNGIRTVAGLVAADLDDVTQVLGRTVGERLHQQARLQVFEREGGGPAYELLPPEAGKGLLRLPEPDAGDVYLDFEGDPFADAAGREYLAGLWDRGGSFTTWWAHSPAEEKALIEGLIDELMRRWAASPSMHIYHYAAYERTKLQALTARHATREAELDQILRAELLVDLYAVVRQGVRISKPSYSIKKLEDFYWGQVRHGVDAEVADALSSVVEYERWIVDQDPQILERIAAYNREDVRSTHDLHAWLEERRSELAAVGYELDRPQLGRVEEVTEAERAEVELTERLVAAGHELLAGCVGWHRREARPAWWDYFRYADMDTPALVEDSRAIGDLGEPVKVGEKLNARTNRPTSFYWRYEFPPQEGRLSIGKPVHDVDLRAAAGTVIEVDPVEGWVTVSRSVRLDPLRSRGFASDPPLRDDVIRAAIARTAEHVLSGADVMGGRLLDGVVPPVDLLVARPGETPADVVVRVGRALDGEVLAVQGPPGAGKTFAAAKLVQALLDDGKTVGVTALSHAVIDNLLREIGRPAVHKTGSGEDDAEDGDESDGALIQRVSSNQEVVAGLRSGEARLVGGTAWLWARDDLAEAVDVLVVDEAGQFSLANAVAVAQAARSVVLLGDPQQLAQPTKAAHPFGAQVSALEHLIGPHDTILADRGVFLETTYRMHPDITSFVSELSYDSRLGSEPGLSAQQVLGSGSLAGSGLRWYAVPHDGRSAASPEEALAVRDLVDDLLAREWVDAKGVRSPLREADILVVAPFNAHVAELRAVLPSNVRVGTVDKFQGRQGAVVVYSMASSSAELAPRGVGFLYDVNRLNVAISRAKALCVLVGSPALLDAHVATPEQLRAVNAVCRYVEVAVPLA